MSGKIFLDTNVLIYAYSAYEPLKKAQAQALIANANGNTWLSTQVLVEFVNVSHRKLKASWADVQIALIELTASYQIAQTTPVTIAHATRLAHRYGFSWFDALIVAAALACDCETLYSEDLNAGQLIEGTLRVVNPFAG
ncbi:MAG: PIN domain-containing protein [Hymenobacter sp.]|nr:MAG: PIN domain-containing protein [Hymenobacter sp.]